MTLIIGAKCSDGIVLGADGAVTFGEFGENTAQHTAKKLQIIDKCVIVGFSGGVGIGQRVIEKIEKFWRDLGHAPIRTEEIEKLTKPIREMLLAEIAAAQAANIKGSIEAAICGTFVALPTGSKVHEVELYYLNHFAAFEKVTKELPFYTTGSGNRYADPFLGFLTKIFWKDKQPDVAEGILGVLWTLRHAIDTNTGGVSQPCQIMTLTRDPTSMKFQAHELSSDELALSHQQISNYELRMKQFLDVPTDQGAPEEPKPPDLTKK